MPRAVEVRDARLEDADLSGEIHILAWQHAYRGLMPDEYLDGLSIPERRQTWRRTLAQEHEVTTHTRVGLLDGRVGGFAIAGAVRDADLEADVGELYAINVHPDTWGRGLGRALVSSCVDGLAADGFRRATLWVLVGNERARRFYESLGWHCEGLEKSGEVLGAQTHEIRYAIDL